MKSWDTDNTYKRIEAYGGGYVKGYSIGEIAEITGISRDRLRHYEKLGIMEPHREEHNQYRCYSDHDIDRILALELFRGAELNLADITKICTDSSVDEIEDYMVQHERKLQEQMKHLERLQRKTKELLEICQRIKSHLNKFSLAETEAFEIVDEIADYRSYPEYRKLKDARLENIPILQKMQRRILFNENGIYENKMVIIKPSVTSAKKRKCVYTIIQDGEGTEDPLEATFAKCMQYCMEKGLQPAGEVYIGMLLLHSKEGKIQSYLEIRGYVL